MRFPLIALLALLPLSALAADPASSSALTFRLCWTHSYGLYLPKLCGNETATDRQSKQIKDNTFNTERDLTDYKSMLSYGFQNTLTRLGPNDHWLDLGAGEAFAGESYLLGDVPVKMRLAETLNGLRLASPSFNYDAPKNLSSKPKVTAVSLVTKRSVAGYDGHLQVLSGRFFSDIPDSEIGKASLETDVYGVLAYTPTLGTDFAKALRLLTTNGALFVYVQQSGGAVRDTRIKKKDGTSVDLLTWMRSIPGVQVEEQPRAWKSPRSVKITKAKDKDIEVPDLKLIGTNEGAPPLRQFEETGKLIPAN